MKKALIKLIFINFFIFLNLLFYQNKLPLKHEEPRRAIIAQEMIFTKNFIVPKICQEPYYKKPPFHNWVIAITSLRDKYISNIDARIPSLFSLIFLSFFIFFLYKNINTNVALISSIIGLTSFSSMISYGVKAEPDMLFTFLFFASYFFFIKDKIFISSLFMGASILTKGISPLFFYLSFLIFLLFEKNKIKFIKKLSIHFFLSLILPIIWIGLYYLKGNFNALLNSLFFEVKDRAVSGIKDIIIDAIEFPYRAFLALFPWSLVFIYSFKKRKINDKILLSSLIIFSVIFLILFIFPCGKGRYFLPAVPFFAIICGNFIDFNKKINLKFLNIFSIIIFIVTFFGMLFFIFKGYYFQSFLIFLIGIFSFIYFKLTINVKEFGLGLAIFILLISSHFINYYRTKYMYNYHKDAIFIVKKLNKFGHLPIVVDERYKKLRLLFNIEREYRMPLYRSKNFKKYIYISVSPLKKLTPIFQKKVKKTNLYFYLMTHS